MAIKITLSSCACAYCGAKGDASKRTRNLRYDLRDREVVCARGYGCARQRPGDARRNGRRHEYRLEGHWYSISDLAALAGVPTPVMRMRLTKLKWDVAVAVGYKIRKRKRIRRDRAVRAAARKAKRDERRQRYARIASELGLSARGFENRVRRLGSVEKAQALGQRRRGGIESSAVAEIIRDAANILGITTRAIRKSAKKRGVSPLEDLLRRAAEPGGEALAKYIATIENPRAHIRRAS